MKLTPPQQEILDHDLLASGFNCVLNMPTGSGKTWLAELAIEATLQTNARAVYVTPLRALATELISRWHSRFPETRIGIFTGDYGGTAKPYPIPFRDAQLLIMTPERLDACTRSWRSHWSWIPEVDLVVIDEIHLLADANRGARLEGTISRVRRLNPFTRIIALSATLGNSYEIAKWLDGLEYTSTWRPIPLSWRIVRYQRASDKPNLLVQEVASNKANGGKSLVFVQSRRRAEELSSLLEGKGFTAEHHHAGLTQEQRRSVEKSFRGYEIDVLVATSTLEMGMNLPVRQVVLYDLQYFNGVDFQPISTISVWQRVGRAGRPGLDEEGEAVLLAPSWDRSVDRYSQGHFEAIQSGYSDERLLAEQIVVEVASRLCRTPKQLNITFGQSLAKQQGVLPEVSSVIDEMLQVGMLEELEASTSNRLKATRLGWIATRHFISPKTILLLNQQAKSEEMTILDLLILCASALECEPVVPVDFEELKVLSITLTQEPSTFLQMPRQELATILNVDGKRLLSSFKMALLMRDWTRLGDIESVTTQYGCYSFEIYRLQESFDRLLLALIAIQADPESKHEFEQNPDPPVFLRERVVALSKMVRIGLDEFAITLTLIDGIGPKTAKKLQVAGLEDIEDLALIEPSQLAELPGISAKRAEKWISEAIELISTRSAYSYKEDKDNGKVMYSDWPSEVDPYRLRRAIDLNISGVEGANYLVKGGLEPHIVHLENGQGQCDCIDASKGHVCKHLLAVRLFKQDLQLKNLVQRLSRDLQSEAIDLFDLWFNSVALSRRDNNENNNTLPRNTPR